MMAFAKLAFYAAVAFFAKNQFDEIGEKPISTDNNIQEQPVQKAASQQATENQIEDYRLLTIK